MKSRNHDVEQHRIAAVPSYNGFYAVWRSNNCRERSAEKDAFSYAWEPLDDSDPSVIDGGVVLYPITNGSGSDLIYGADSMAGYTDSLIVSDDDDGVRSWFSNKATPFEKPGTNEPTATVTDGVVRNLISNNAIPFEEPNLVDRRLQSATTASALRS